MPDTSLFGLNDLSEKLNASVGQTGTGTDSTTMATTVGDTVQTWLQTSIFPLVIGAVIFVTVLAVFYGAFLYFTAYGDENRATTAKKSITYGFIGLFIALAAFTITSYVRQNLISKDAEQNIYDKPVAPVTEGGNYGQSSELFK